MPQPDPAQETPTRGPAARSFTGRARQRTTRRSVVIADRTAGGLITVGGIGTILAVLGVALFLIWVVLPLFLPADVSDLDTVVMDWPGQPLEIGVDEYRTLGWALLPTGTLEVFRLDTGEKRLSQQLFEEGRLISASFLLEGSQAVFGLVDGTIQLGNLRFATQTHDADTFPPEIRRQVEAVPQGAPVSYEDGIVQMMPSS